MRTEAIVGNSPDDRHGSLDDFSHFFLERVEHEVDLIDTWLGRGGFGFDGVDETGGSSQRGDQLCVQRITKERRQVLINQQR